MVRTSDRKRALPTVRYLDTEDDVFGKQDVYGFEMVRRLLLEIRRSSTLLRSLRDEICKRNGSVRLESRPDLTWLGPWTESRGIPQESSLGQALLQTAQYWLNDRAEMDKESPFPYIPPISVAMEEITLGVGWDRTRETWEQFERRIRRQAKPALNDFLKQYKAEVMKQTERVRRYSTESIHWLVWKAWGFDERGQPWSWRAIASKAQCSVPTVKLAVRRLAHFYGLRLMRRSVGGRPPGPSLSKSNR